MSVVSTEVATHRPSGADNFQVAARVVENLYTPELSQKVPPPQKNKTEQQQ
jgi:hypothetical protein